MVIVGVELETLVSEPDALTTRPPPCGFMQYIKWMLFSEYHDELLCFIERS